MKIAFVVCGNGYGHLKRVCDVVSQIFDLDRSVSVLLLGASHHEDMLNRWDVPARLSHFSFTFSNAELEKNLKAVVAPEYTFGTYLDSFDLTTKALASFHPDRVVSDNLAGVLKYFPHSMLMGSFLWSDILPSTYPHHEEVMRICEFENDLLEKIKPPLMGVKDIAMPEARAKTNFIGFPWFCTPSKKRSVAGPSNSNILVTGGGTGNASEALLEIARYLEKERDFVIMLDRVLYEKANGHFSLFDFNPTSFSTLDWIVCRPGIGILTDAVKYRIPVCALEDNDAEMRHNAKRVEELGIGIRIKSKEHSFLNSDVVARWKEMRSRLDSLQTGGAQRAAAHILNSKHLYSDPLTS